MMLAVGGWPCKDSLHYFIECKLYQIERATLLTRLHENTDIPTILFGNDLLSNEYKSRFFFPAVQSYIKNTQRFGK